MTMTFFSHAQLPQNHNLFFAKYILQETFYSTWIMQITVKWIEGFDTETRIHSLSPVRVSGYTVRV